MGKVVEAAEGLRERKKARTRAAILEAALDLFDARGYDATTVEDVAAAAEVSPRTFFRYFESKLDLIMAHANDKQHVALGDALAARPADEGVLTALRGVVREQLDVQLADPLVRREFQVMLTTPALRNLAREHFYEEEAHLVGAVAGRLGLPPDDLRARVVAGAVASAMWVVIERWIDEGAELDQLHGFLDVAFDTLARGFDETRIAPGR